MSITKQQARALADGFIDSIGSGNAGTLQPRETFTEIILIAGELVEDAQKNLDKTDSVASGRLSRSIQANDPKLRGSVFEVGIEMNFYGLFINKGVKGTKSGSSKAGYSFKNDFVSKKMVEAIQKWIKRSSLQQRTAKPIYSLEKKRKAISALNKGRSVAYAVSRRIKQHGIKTTGFFDKAAKDARTKIGQRLGAALKIDVITSIKI